MVRSGKEKTKERQERPARKLDKSGWVRESIDFFVLIDLPLRLYSPAITFVFPAVTFVLTFCIDMIFVMI